MNRFKIRDTIKNLETIDAEEEKAQEIIRQQLQYKEYLQSIGMWNPSIFN